jgi:hypothetical protein
MTLIGMIKEKRGSGVAATLAAFALTGAGLVYLLSRSLYADTEVVDFRYIWHAGRMWNEGLNPYSDLYQPLSRRTFSGPNQLHFWVYPPHFWPFSASFALLDYELARRLWQALGLSCIAGSLLILLGTYLDLKQVVHRLLAGVVALLALTMAATASSLFLGQTAPMILLGLALFVRAARKGGEVAMAAGFALLSLKVNFALPFIALALATPEWRRALVGGGVISSVFALPPILISGPINVAQSWLGNLSAYSDFEANLAKSTTGMRNILHHAADVSASPFLLVIVGSALVFLVGRLALRIEDKKSITDALVCFTLLSTTFFVPLHIYDALLIIPVIIMMPGTVWWMFFVIGFLLIYRAKFLALFSGFYDLSVVTFYGSFFSSLVYLALFITASVAVVVRGLAAVGRLELLAPLNGSQASTPTASAARAKPSRSSSRSSPRSRRGARPTPS